MQTSMNKRVNIIVLFAVWAVLLFAGCDGSKAETEVGSENTAAEQEQGSNDEADAAASETTQANADSQAGDEGHDSAAPAEQDPSAAS